MTVTNDTFADQVLSFRYETLVKPEWIDSNKHMKATCYQIVFDEASLALLDVWDYGEAYRARTLHTAFVVEVHLRYLRELMLGDPLLVVGQILAIDDKRFQMLYELKHGSQGYVAATCEGMVINIDQSTRRAAPFLPELKERLDRIVAIYGQQAPYQGPRFVQLGSRREG